MEPFYIATSTCTGPLQVLSPALTICSVAVIDVYLQFNILLLASFNTKIIIVLFLRRAL